MDKHVGYPTYKNGVPMEPTVVSVEIGGRTLSIETGVLAKQAQGAVVVRQDESTVLVTACASKDPVLFFFCHLPLHIKTEPLLSA